jgi:CrcB protein
MFQLIYIGIGGFLGAIARFLLSRSIGEYFPNFPYGTLMVNVLGSLLLGFIGYSILYSRAITPELRNLINIGFIGAFTTMSTFAFETVRIIEAGQLSIAFLNITSNLLFSLLAISMGRWVAIILAK